MFTTGAIVDAEFILPAALGYGQQIQARGNGRKDGAVFARF